MSVEDRTIAQSLSAQEKIIERGAKVFLEVGVALAAIRDSKLYRLSYKTFEAYCQERWGYEKRRANQLIAAAEVREQLFPKIEESELPKTESQLREVAKAPPEKRAEVVQIANKAAWAEDRNPTAKDFATAAAAVLYEDVESEASPTLETERECRMDAIRGLETDIGRIVRRLQTLGLLNATAKSGIELLKGVLIRAKK